MPFLSERIWLICLPKSVNLKKNWRTFEKSIFFRLGPPRVRSKKIEVGLFCIPKFLCTKQHSEQTKTPRLIEAHWGSEAPQSAHTKIEVSSSKKSIYFCQVD